MKGYELLIVLASFLLQAAALASLGLHFPSAQGRTVFLCLAEVW